MRRYSRNNGVVGIEGEVQAIFGLSKEGAAMELDFQASFGRDDERLQKFKLVSEKY